LYSGLDRQDPDPHVGAAFKAVFGRIGVGDSEGGPRIGRGMRSE
jgi:hypothetical protein